MFSLYGEETFERTPSELLSNNSPTLEDLKEENIRNYNLCVGGLPAPPLGLDIYPPLYPCDLNTSTISNEVPIARSFSSSGQSSPLRYFIRELYPDLKVRIWEVTNTQQWLKKQVFMPDGYKMTELEDSSVGEREDDLDRDWAWKPAEKAWQTVYNTQAIITVYDAGGRLEHFTEGRGKYVYRAKDGNVLIYNEQELPSKGKGQYLEKQTGRRISADWDKLASHQEDLIEVVFKDGNRFRCARKFKTTPLKIDSLFNGPGTFSYTDGSEFKGEFEFKCGTFWPKSLKNGQFFHPELNLTIIENETSYNSSKIIIRFNNASTFKGERSSESWRGIFTNPDSSTFEGEFIFEKGKIWPKIGIGVFYPPHNQKKHIIKIKGRIDDTDFSFVEYCVNGDISENTGKILHSHRLVHIKHADGGEYNGTLQSESKWDAANPIDGTGKFKESFTGISYEGVWANGECDDCKITTLHGETYRAPLKKKFKICRSDSISSLKRSTIVFQNTIEYSNYNQKRFVTLAYNQNFVAVSSFFRLEIHVFSHSSLYLATIHPSGGLTYRPSRSCSLFRSDLEWRNLALALLHSPWLRFGERSNKGYFQTLLSNTEMSSEISSNLIGLTSIDKSSHIGDNRLNLAKTPQKVVERECHTLTEIEGKGRGVLFEREDLLFWHRQEDGGRLEGLHIGTDNRITEFENKVG